MQFITGRIVLIGENNIISKADGSFSSVTFVIKKRMKKKLRNIAFKCYGKLADKVLNFRLNDKVEIEFLIDSKQSQNPKYNGHWSTSLQAVAVDHYESAKNKHDIEINFRPND